MKFKKIIYNDDFILARIICYLVITMFYIYVAYFYNFQCSGCPLCGMTRATKKLLVLDLKTAFDLNKNIGIVAIMELIIVMDIIIIFINFIKQYIKGGQ